MLIWSIWKRNDIIKKKLTKWFYPVLLQQEQILVSGAADGCLQIRTRALDPLKPPQKTLDLQMYDFYSSPIECLAVHNGIVFTGGENGVFFCVDCSEAGLPRDIKPLSTSLSLS